MRRSFRRLSRLIPYLVSAFACSSIAVAQQVTRVEHVTFATNSIPQASSTLVIVRALLYIPTNASQPSPVVVITSSSGGVRDDVEIHYASNLARSGIAALVIDSFGSRGVAHTIHNQRQVNEWQMVNDAIAGLRFLIADGRFARDRIGIMGVSKGGIVARLTALTSVLNWAAASDNRFAAHIAIVPHCGWVPRSRTSTGAPLLFLLAELDDQCPPEDCARYAETLKENGNPSVEVTLYKGAYHPWEVLGELPHFDKWAQNFSKCRAIIDEDGVSTLPSGARIRSDEAFTWALEIMSLLARSAAAETKFTRSELRMIERFFFAGTVSDVCDVDRKLREFPINDRHWA